MIVERIPGCVLELNWIDWYKKANVYRVYSQVM